jgi:carbonic anhydrase
VSHHHHAVSCACCHPLSAQVGRRGLLFGAAALALAPRFVLAAEGKYEAMILGCIDPRLQGPVRDYAVKRGLNGKYSQFTIAGAAVGVVAPAFEKWHQAFWDNLAATIQLHSIETVIAIDHRDCGAVKIAYGDDSIATPDKENATHSAALAEFRKQVGQRQPKLKVETILMALDGSFISLG